MQIISIKNGIRLSGPRRKHQTASNSHIHTHAHTQQTSRSLITLCVRVRKCTKRAVKRETKSAVDSIEAAAAAAAL